MSGKVTFEEAVLQLRSRPEYRQLFIDAYLGEDPAEAARSFASSGEFAELKRILGPRLEGGTVLDLGAGTGVASYAFAISGASRVIAVEPDPSDVVGRGAIVKAAQGMPVEIVSGVGESLPLPDESVDIVYARQVLHHSRDLDALMRECARVLRPNGVFIASREHVVDDEAGKQQFLSEHIMHRLAGNEGAYRADQYIGAIRRAGLKVTHVLGSWESVLNTFPTVGTQAELEELHADKLRRRLGFVGDLLARIPAVRALVGKWMSRPRTPGRLNTFIAVKPATAHSGGRG